MSPLKCIPSRIYTIIEKLMAYDPEQRITLIECYYNLREYIFQVSEDGEKYMLVCMLACQKNIFIS